MRLRDRLRNLFTNWSDTYPPTWSVVLSGVAPSATNVPASLQVSAQVPLIPQPHQFPSSPEPNQFHTMRALDRVRPSEVRVVVIGQDPYPRRRQATGRAFEQGDFTYWGGGIAYGLKHIAQRLAQYRSGNAKYVQGDAAWNRVVADASSLGLTSVSRLYDRWEDQGVIFLNYVLTYTLPDHVFGGHDRFWAPVTTAILRYLATRQSKRVVFATWGGKPGAFFSGAGVLQAAQAAGTFGNCRILRYSHPSARPSQYGSRPPFLNGGNPFREINAKLTELGESVVDW